MKVIFLDIDGVMNCEISHEEKALREFDRLIAPGLTKDQLRLIPSRSAKFYRPSVEALNHILEETGARIVISSSWRYHRSVEELEGVLSANGIRPGSVADKIPDLTRKTDSIFLADIRGHEIKAWLSEHPEVKAYVVIDDDKDAGVGHETRFVETDFRQHGLNAEHATRAIDILQMEVVSE